MIRSALMNLRRREIAVAGGVKRAAVLLPLFHDRHNNNQLSVLFTERSPHLSSHGGEISFPGGKQEENETAIETSIRETIEEIGCRREEIEILGLLHDVTSLKNIAVTPCVGYFRSGIDISLLRPQASEVQSLFSVPITHLQQKENRVLQHLSRGRIPAFSLPHRSDIKIWGLTGYVLNDFLVTAKFIDPIL